MVTDYQGYTGLDGAGLSDAYWSWLCRTIRCLLVLMVPDYLRGILALMVTDYQGYTGLDGAELSDAYWSWLCQTNRGLLALMVPDYQRSTVLLQSNDRRHKHSDNEH